MDNLDTVLKMLQQLSNSITKAQLLVEVDSNTISLQQSRQARQALSTRSSLNERDGDLLNESGRCLLQLYIYHS